MDRNIQRNGLVNIMTMLLVGVPTAWLAEYAKTDSGTASVCFLLFGFLVAAVSYFQMRLESQERAEKLEYEEVARGRAGATMFDKAEAESFPARRSREQFEKIFVPVFTILLVVLQGLSIYYVIKKFDPTTTPTVARAQVSAALYLGSFLMLFVLGKYSASIARIENQRLLRPGAGYMMLNAFISLVMAIVEAASWFGYSKVDEIVARILWGVIGLIALETLFNLVFEIYRPRRKGQQTRLLYDSRLVGLLGEPDNLLTTAAQTLDYQFGFKVSETWFPRFLGQNWRLIVLGQAGVLFASTMIVIVENNEQVLLERMGRPAGDRAVLNPGLHFKLPWPMEKAYRYNTTKLQSVNIGFVTAEGMPEEDTMVWTRPHYKEEYNLLVASRDPLATTNATSVDQAAPVSLLTVGIPVHYLVTNLEAWVYNHADATNLLEKVATREVVRYLISVDFDNIMAVGRQQASIDLQQRIQKRADDLKLGAKIIFVGLQDIHPPVTAAPVYEEVAVAMQAKEGMILSAQGYETEVIPAAQAAAATRVALAEASKLREVAAATATGARFTNQINAWNASRSVYAQRTYLETMNRALAAPRKYIIATTNTHDVYSLNLEQKIRDDIIRDVSMPTPDKKVNEEKKK